MFLSVDSLEQYKNHKDYDSDYWKSPPGIAKAISFVFGLFLSFVVCVAYFESRIIKEVGIVDFDSYPGIWVPVRELLLLSLTIASIPISIISYASHHFKKNIWVHPNVNLFDCSFYTITGFLLLIGSVLMMTSANLIASELILKPNNNTAIGSTEAPCQKYEWKIASGIMGIVHSVLYMATGFLISKYYEGDL